MRNHGDHPIYRTFEEFEREEIRRADAVGGVVDSLFDDMFTGDAELAVPGEHAGVPDYSDDEE